MTSPSFTEALATRPWLLADGATGTNYFQMGLESGDAPEMWNLEHPERVRSLHRRFIEAGADIVLTNSFGGNRHRLKLHNAQDRVRELNVAAARLARFGRCVILDAHSYPTGPLPTQLAFGPSPEIGIGTQPAHTPPALRDLAVDFSVRTGTPSASTCRSAGRWSRTPASAATRVSGR